MLEFGLDLEAVDIEGQTPLHWAGKSGNGIDVIEVLVEVSLGPHLEPPPTASPWKPVPRLRPTSRQKTSRAANRSTLPPSTGVTLPFLASWASGRTSSRGAHILTRRARLIPTPNGHRTHAEETPLHQAASGEQPESVFPLVEQKADLYAKDKEDRSPLHLAAFFGYCGALEALVACKANVDHPGRRGRSPIFEATDRGEHGSLACLLGLKA